jgi:hypothetical protein
VIRAVAGRIPKTAWAALLFAVLVVGYLWPALFGGKVLTSLSVLYTYPPGDAVAPPDLKAYLNPLLSDPARQFYPWAVFAHDSLHSGVFPAWNPYALGGTPFFANANVAVLSPFTLPFLIFPIKLALGVSGALKLWVAAFGMYLLVRELRLSFWAGVVAGVSFALCAFNVVWLSHPQTHVAVLLPALLWLAERTLRTRRAGPAAGLSVLLAATVAGGHPGTIVHVMSALAIYVAVRLLADAPVAWRARLRGLALVTVGVVLGILLLSVVLLPAAELTPNSTGLLGRMGGGGAQEGFVLRTLLFPDWWGRPSSIDLLALPNFNERTMYFGTVAAVFAVIGLGGGQWRRKLPFVAIAAFGFAVAFATPLRALVVELPGFDRVNNARIVLLIMFGLAVLAAFGVQELIDRRSVARRVSVVVALGCAISLVAAISLHPSWLDVRVTQKHFRTGADFPRLPNTIPLTSIGWFVLIALGVLVAVLAARLTGRRRLAAAAVAGLAVLDMGHFAGRYQPLVPSRYAEPPRTPLVGFLARHRNEGRMVGVGPMLATDWQMSYRLRDVRGYDPPEPDLRYFRLWLLANPTQTPAPGDLNLPAVTPAGLKVISLLGARYIAVPFGAPKPLSLTGLSMSYAGRDGTVWENALATPRVLVPRTVNVATGEADLFSRVVRPDFDARRSAVVERAQLGRRAPPVGAGGAAWVDGEANAQVTVRAHLAAPGLVVLNDRLTKGWSVQVDGRSATALRVNGVMRGVRVPAGDHRVAWRYRTPGVTLGAILSGLSLLVVVLTLATLTWRRRRPAGQPDPPATAAATES